MKTTLFVILLVALAACIPTLEMTPTQSSTSTPTFSPSPSSTASPSPSKTPSIITTEGQLFPTEWEQRYQLSFSDSLSNPEVYDQLSQILSDNATKILADTSHGVPTCHSMPWSPEDASQLAPSRLPLLYSGANIGAVYEIQQPEGTSYVVTITCKGPNPSEVLAKPINLYFSWDLKNYVIKYPDYFVGINPDTYVFDYIQYLLSTGSTVDTERLRVVTWGGGSV